MNDAPPPPPLTKEQRRERREARRQKQRAANVGRARKMHLARLAAPTKPPATKPPKKTATPTLHIGCSGWFYWDWRRRFYPESLPTNQWFSHYLRHFKTVELNAPFYSWPTLATVQTWLKQAGRHRFTYTVKVNELITHTRRFKNTKTLVQDFSYIADLLGPRMGCFLFQLPPSFHYTPARLKNILAQLDHTRRNVLEFRHRSWWNETVYAALRKTNTIFCSCSAPRLPNSLIQTAPEIYIRFHGLKQWYRHDYSKQELAHWTTQIQAANPTTVYAYFNNDRNAHAIANAQELLRQLKSSSKPNPTKPPR